MANGKGNGASTVQQIVMDPDFQNLSAQDQQGVLAHFDSGFGQLSTNELPGVITALQKSALTRPDLAQPSRYAAPPAGAGTPQEVPNYTAQALNPPGGFTTQGQFLAGTTPEERNTLAVAGAVGLTPAAGYAAAPYLTAVARSPVGQELIKSAVQSAIKGAGLGAGYEVWKTLRDKLFGNGNK
jgi:hypothetical protein